MKRFLSPIDYGLLRLDCSYTYERFIYQLVTCKYIQHIILEHPIIPTDIEFVRSVSKTQPQHSCRTYDYHGSFLRPFWGVSFSAVTSTRYTTIIIHVTKIFNIMVFKTEIATQLHRRQPDTTWQHHDITVTNIILLW